MIKPTTVWMVEDNENYRETVAEFLSESAAIDLRRSFPACEPMLEAIQNDPPPQALLMDIGLPGISGIEGVKRVKENFPDVQIIMFTVYQDNERIFDALCSGATGYLLKSSSPEEIEQAIRDAVDGGAPINPQIAKKVLDRFIKTPVNKKYGLTDREKEILNLLVEGLPKKGIAARLHVSFHTIDTHIKNIYTKLQVHSGNEAVAKAIRENLI